MRSHVSINFDFKQMYWVWPHPRHFIFIQYIKLQKMAQVNRVYFSTFSAKVFPMVSFKGPLNLHSISLFSPRPWLSFFLRAPWACRRWLGYTFLFCCFATPGAFSVPRASVLEISLKREACRYCMMPVLSAGSFPRLQTDLQGLHWQDQGLREPFSLMSWGKGGR